MEHGYQAILRHAPPSNQRPQFVSYEHSQTGIMFCSIALFHFSASNQVTKTVFIIELTLYFEIFFQIGILNLLIKSGVCIDFQTEGLIPDTYFIV